MRLRRLPQVDAEQEADADVVRLLLPVRQALPARSLAAEAEERTRRGRLPTPLSRHEAKRFGMQAAPNATLLTCVAQPAASTWCETRW